MTDSAFRRLPVDLYDEDRVLVSDLYPADPRPAAQILSDTQRTAQDVRQLVQRGDAVQALKLALEQAPYDGGEQDADRQLHEAKNINLGSISAVLNSTKSTDIPNIVSQLEPQEQVTLMKYLYKSMEQPDAQGGNSNVVLGWHEKLVEVAGTGCIVRVMTDRRRI